MPSYIRNRGSQILDIRVSQGNVNVIYDKYVNGKLIRTKLQCCDVRGNSVNVYIDKHSR
jgi:hypothetical protein